MTPAIVLWPNPILKTVCERVVRASDMGSLVEEMKKTMLDAGGIGLAANQLGYNHRVIVVTTVNGPVGMINPEIISHLGNKVLGTEGCLSVPNVYESILRWPSVTVRYDTTSDLESIETLTGLEAAIFQHELEHIDGKIFLDKLPPGKKDQIRAFLRRNR